MVLVVSSLEARTGIKPTTLASYRRLLRQVLDLELNDPSIAGFIDGIVNPNTKRSTIIALRAIGYTYQGEKPRVTKQYPRIYNLPDEETLRLVLSYSKYEVQYLTMMYLGLRMGEACYANKTQLLPGSRFYVNLQVAEWVMDGRRHTEIREPKSIPAVIDIPAWLADLLPAKPNPLVPTNLRAALSYTTKHYLGYNLPAHALRHWYATSMIERGIPLPVVQRQMRHSDIATTLRTYAQFSTYRMGIFDNAISV